MAEKQKAVDKKVKVDANIVAQPAYSQAQIAELRRKKNR